MSTSLAALACHYLVLNSTVLLLDLSEEIIKWNECSKIKFKLGFAFQLRQRSFKDSLFSLDIEGKR